jgi:hypothetical protein
MKVNAAILWLSRIQHRPLALSLLNRRMIDWYQKSLPSAEASRSSGGGGQPWGWYLVLVVIVVVVILLLQ